MRRIVTVVMVILVVGLVVVAGCTSSGTSSVKPSVSAATPTPLAHGDEAKGKAIYVSLCYGCHAPEAKVGPSFVSDGFKGKYQTADALMKVVRTGRHPMPQFSREQLNDQGIVDLLAYIKTAK
ncbi:MAG: cytochrome c [Chloroflexi bacterium]|nr:cytochrome c [Chloroflexota bacterium]